MCFLVKKLVNLVYFLKWFRCRCLNNLGSFLSSFMRRYILNTCQIASWRLHFKSCQFITFISEVVVWMFSFHNWLKLYSNWYMWQLLDILEYLQRYLFGKKCPLFLALQQFFFECLIYQKVKDYVRYNMFLCPKH